jgi:magnesium transporter
MLGQLILPEIQDMIANRNFRELRDALAEFPSADLAELFDDLDQSDAVVVFRLLPKDLATEVFEHLDLVYQKSLLEHLKSTRLKELLQDMSPDDRTALLEELPTKAANRLMMMLTPEERHIARTLLNYPEDSVGRVMTPDFVYLKPSMNVEEALIKIRMLGIDRETVHACYIVDQNMNLLGYVTLTSIVTSPLNTPVWELMEDNMVKINAQQDQEEAAELLGRYDLAALPVVDRDDHLVGIVTFDDILDIIEEEFTEDAHLQAAVTPLDENYLAAKPWDLARNRVLWLVILLIAETLGVLLLKRYDDFIQATIALALFLPVMIATGGNTGTQSAALVIRAIATGDVRLKDGIKVIGRELIVSAILSTILGVIAFLLVFVMEGTIPIALCIGIGLATIVTLSNLIGTMLPLILERIGLDPAMMSGPFISTIIDILGLVIYLEISMKILGLFD